MSRYVSPFSTLCLHDFPFQYFYHLTQLATVLTTECITSKYNPIMSSYAYVPQCCQKKYKSKRATHTVDERATGTDICEGIISSRQSVCISLYYTFSLSVKVLLYTTFFPHLHKSRWMQTVTLYLSQQPETQQRKRVCAKVCSGEAALRPDSRNVVFHSRQK